MRQFQSVLGLPLGSRGMQDFSPYYTKRVSQITCIGPTETVVPWEAVHRGGGVQLC